MNGGQKQAKFRSNLDYIQCPVEARGLPIMPFWIITAVFSQLKIPVPIFVIRQTQIIPNDSQWRISETVLHRTISKIQYLFVIWICTLKTHKSQTKTV